MVTILSDELYLTDHLGATDDWVLRGQELKSRFRTNARYSVVPMGSILEVLLDLVFLIQESNEPLGQLLFAPRRRPRVRLGSRLRWLQD